MPTIPSLTSLTAIDLSKLELPKVELPKFDLPKLELPKVDVPKVELPDVTLPSVDRVAAVARDAAYVGIGAAVLTVQQAQVRRRELQAAVKKVADRVVAAVG